MSKETETTINIYAGPASTSGAYTTAGTYGTSPPSQDPGAPSPSAPASPPGDSDPKGVNIPGGLEIRLSEGIEGRALTLSTQENRVYSAFRRMYPTPEHLEVPPFQVWDVYADYLIVKNEGEFYKVGYALDENEAPLFADIGDWEKVREERDWIPTKAANPLKAISRDEDTLRVGNYMVLFGGRDLTGEYIGPNQDGTKGEYFTKNTEFSSPYTQTGILYVDWEHGGGGPGEPPKDEILGVVDWKTARFDSDGLWVERVLDRRNKYMQHLEALIDQGLIGNSSEAVFGKTKRAEDGRILVWPLKRDTLTVTPMEPRMLRENAIALKAISGLSAFSDSLKAMLPQEDPVSSEHSEGEGEAIKTGRDNSATNQPGEDPPSTEAIMPKETNTEEAQNTPVMYDEDTVKSIIDAALEKYSASVEPENNKSASTVVVIEDETDKKAKQPWQDFGEFLGAVKTAATPGLATDPRLHTKAPTGLSEGVPSDGGFLVSTDHANDLLRRTYEMGEITSRVRTYPISPNANGLTINAIDETSRVNGSRWGGITGYWLDEAGTKIASRPKFRQMELKLKKLIGLCYATDELLQDTVALGALIQDGFAEEFSFLVEDSIINGTGAGRPLGILKSGALVSVAKETGQSATTIVFENIVKMWSRAYGRSRRNAVWLINQDIEPQLYGLNLAVGTGGQTVFLPPGGLSASPYGTLFGRPIIPCEYCATLGTVGDIVLADFSQYVMINKGGMDTATSIHVRFIYDETAFRFVLRTDGEPGWNAPLTPANGTNTLSPFVALATRS